MAVAGDASFHEIPSQRRARGDDDLAAAGNQTPTARQNFVLRQETAVKLLTSDPAGLGLGITFHFEPFQDSIRVEPEADPTATQSLAWGQLIAARELKSGLGAVINDQVEPFHRSMNDPELAWLSEPPTAKQDLGEAQETPLKALPVTPPGLALGTIFHAAGIAARAGAPWAALWPVMTRLARERAVTAMRAVTARSGRLGARRFAAHLANAPPVAFVVISFPKDLVERMFLCPPCTSGYLLMGGGVKLWMPCRA